MRRFNCYRIRSLIQSFMVLLLLVSGGMASAATLTGRVYEGSTGSEPPPLGNAKPLAGVTVTLYGSQDASQQGTFVIDTDTTDSDGWYSLTVRGVYDFYNIVQTNKAGYVDSDPSPAATSVGGTVKSSNWIQYSFAGLSGTTTGNKFWDKLPGENRPPVALDDFYSMQAGHILYVAAPGVLGNDSDPDGDPLEAHLFTVTMNASSVGTWGDGSFTYTPKDGFSGTDYFTYLASDPYDAYDEATVYIEVLAEELCTINVYKWEDKNGDCVWDAVEQGLANWKICLDNNQNCQCDPGEPYKMTDATGWCWFDVACQSTYYLAEELKPGWQRTCPTSPPCQVDIHTSSPQAVYMVWFGNQQVTGQYDYGDAPSNYPSASHQLGGPWFGDTSDLPDAEPANQPDPAAMGDDNDAQGDDEDGIGVVGDLVKGHWALLVVTEVAPGSGDATEAGWIDYNRNGSWDDPGEFLGQHNISHGTPPPGGLPVLKVWSIQVPANAQIGTTFARFRIYEGQNASVSSKGAAGPGEVEDHQVQIKPDGTLLPPGGVIVGTKFNDINGNGIWDLTEPPLANWKIYLDINQNGICEASEPWQLTDNSGIFLFTGLSPGSYVVAEELQPNWIQTFPGMPGTHTIPAQQGLVIGIRFGNQQIGVQGLDWGDAPDIGVVPVTAPPNGSLGITGLMSIREVINNGPIADQTACKNSLQNIGLSASVAEYMAATLNIDDGGVPGHFGNDDVFGVVQSNQTTYGNVDDLSLLAMGAIRIPSGGDYTFCVSSDDGFTFRILGFAPLSWPGDRAFADSPQVYNLPVGDHFFVLFYHEHGGAAGLELSAAKGAKTSFDNSFQLVGSPGGLQLVTPASYPTVLNTNGACHTVVSDFHLGQAVDDEPDGQASPDALGDDHLGTDDEDGVSFLTPLVAGSTADLKIVASAPGFVDAWIDFDSDGNWRQLSDQILNTEPVQAGSNWVTIAVPASAQSNEVTFARFRLSRTGGLPFDGDGQDGEVEDYQILLGHGGPSVPGEGEEYRYLKWSQPTIEIDPKVEQTPVFCGWDEPAFSVQTSGQQRRWTMAADDFHCLGPIPVTSVRWWGSFANWTEETLPSVAPTAFHLGIWSGVPADTIYTWGRPETLVWEKTCDDWTWQFAGYERSEAGSAASISSTGLVAHYRFDGNANDSSGNNLHGTAYGGPSYVAGVLGQAISLDGINDYVDCGNSSLFDFTNAMTAGAWVNIRSIPDEWRAIVTKGDSAWRISTLLSQRKFHFAVAGPPDYPAADGTREVPVGQWHHVAGTYDGATIRLYVDGVLDVTRVYSGGIGANTQPVFIGENAEQMGRTWHGLIDDVRVYNRALSADEIKSLAVPSSQQQTDENCFEFNCNLPTGDWFHQERFQTQDETFWLSITALYGGSSEGPNPWGWASRPNTWRDGVVGFEWTGQQLQAGLVLDPKRMTPVRDEACGYEQASDMAFELRTDPNWIKWDQPFTGIRDWPHYDDHASYSTQTASGTVTIVQRVVDDWSGVDPLKPVIAIAWHGSYIGHGYEACRCDPTVEPRRPDCFQLLIFRNAPVDSDSALDQPGSLAWAYEAFDYDEVLVGYDRHPSGEPNEPVFRYSVRLPRDKWFWQQGGNQQVYWLSITAVYVARPDQIDYPWGWTDRKYTYGSTALALTETGQVLQSKPLSDPTGGSVDMSFTLYTTSESKPIAHWGFDEATGNIAVDSIGGHNGMIHGATWTTGVAAGALRFDGGDYVEISDEAVFDITDAITVAAWVNLEAVPAEYIGIITKGDSTWRLSTLQAQRCFHFAVNYPQSVFHAVDGTTRVGLNEWHHVVGTYDGTSLRLYVDGVEEPGSPVAYTGPINNDNFPVWIGANAEQPGRGFVGRIDEVLVYDVALSAADVSDLMALAE